MIIHNTSANETDLDIQIQADLTSHSDKLFKQIMDLDNVTPSDIYESLNLEMNRNMVFKAGEGAGQSGSFFFFSYDNKFLIKTMTSREVKLLLSKLELFLNHYKKCDNQTLIAKIYGVFTIKSNIFAPL